MKDSEFTTTLAAYRAWCTEHTGDLLTSATGHAVAYLANTVIGEAVAEINRLKAELDRYQGHHVMYCTEDQAADVLATVSDAGPGTIIRATDSGREWVLRGAGWVER